MSNPKQVAKTVAVEAAKIAGRGIIKLVGKKMKNAKKPFWRNLYYAFGGE